MEYQRERIDQNWLINHVRLLFCSISIRSDKKKNRGYMLDLGKINSLRVQRKASCGMFLGENSEQVVLLPNKYVRKDLDIDHSIDVFLYTDSENRIVATTLTPKFFLHQFAVLEVKDITKFGAFLDWGLEKDLLLPFSEQQERLQEGDKVTVCLCLDEQTGRLFASAKIDECTDQKLSVHKGEEVDLLIDRKSEIGWQVIINDRHTGLIFFDKIFQTIRKGDKIKGFIDNIREDGKIDVSLQKQGYSQVEDSQDLLLKKLQENRGILHLTDKSDAKLISRQLGMSKKVFKKCVGALYKQRKIEIKSDCIVLLKEKI